MNPFYKLPKPPSFSHLESSIVQNEVKPRPNSLEMNNVWHNARLPSRQVNEFDLKYSLDPYLDDLSDVDSVHGALKAVQMNTHLANKANFSDCTSIRCLKVDMASIEWNDMDDNDLSCLLEQYRDLRERSERETANLPLSDSSTPKKLLVLFVPLIPMAGTSFGNKIPITQSQAAEVFSSLKLNPLFFLNMLGRPDYWAPQTRWKFSSHNHLESCDFFCQHPRWNLDVQGAPLSTCLRYEVSTGQIIYIIAHKENDSSVEALTQIICKSIRTPAELTSDPFDLHVLLSTLSFEASKYHVTHFRRFMWSQFNRVEEQIAGVQTKDRKELRELTRQLQIISQNADSHIANADVAMMSARCIQASHAKMHLALKSLPCRTEKAADAIDYVIQSLEKQKLWFLNYKNRKDGMMSLVFNLVTQQDAANTIEIAADTKRDSTSMNAIAALTMIFLPGTFTATILGAGIFSANLSGDGIHVSNLWWLWIAFTAPLTIGVVIGWWYYYGLKEKNIRSKSQDEEDKRKETPV
ncbi:uncharacterized protein TRUGW13939_07583 [Talaromyces rugulosus]|uniref:Uncharacterized protein n=1 Tax=Talaromyces rugulosus TaxID=121627 RepID=A0A7H8R342_TALRU|nr:uncharacterized protein TRUGW13939_07583 [Talaromyces rugulosus]QKX60438.1 hypothetical protein TRUGW13939_07583 [Talaromyces rugulosus]